MQNNDRIQYIDTWRFVAIALVIASHIVEFSHPWYQENFPGLVWRLRYAGSFGVQIFFCISGFVITRGILKELAQAQTINIKGFYTRRFFRIIPPLLLYILGAALFATTGLVKVSSDQVMQSIFFMCNIKEIGDCGWSLGHTWSLAFEEQFYLFFPIFVAGVGLSVQIARKRFALGAAFLLIAASISLVSSRPDLSKCIYTFNFMLTGCVFAAYWSSIGPLMKRAHPLVWGIIALLTFSMGCLLPVSDSFRPVLSIAIMPIAICIMVLGTPVVIRSISKIFLNKSLCHLGKISFSLYLWQQLATGNYNSASPLFALFGLAGVLVFSLLSYKYFELPLIKLGAQLSESFRSKPKNDSNKVKISEC